MDLDSPEQVCPPYIVPARVVSLTELSSYIGTDDATKIRIRLQAVRTELNVPPSEPLPIGVGVLCWIADKPGNEEMVLAILAEHPKAIWLAFGTDLSKYVKQIREYNEKNGTSILIVVSATSLEEALQAANEWKVDILNVQGDLLLNL